MQRTAPLPNTTVSGTASSIPQGPPPSVGVIMCNGLLPLGLALDVALFSGGCSVRPGPLPSAPEVLVPTVEGTPASDGLTSGAAAPRACGHGANAQRGLHVPQHLVVPGRREIDVR